MEGEDAIYSCFDLPLRSAIPLVELTRAADAGDTRPIVDVRLGAVPETLPGSGDAQFGLQVAQDAALLTVTGEREAARLEQHIPVAAG